MQSLTRTLPLTLLAALTTQLWAAGPQVWTISESQEYLKGELSGLTLDSDGHLGLGRRLRAHYNSEASFLWSTALGKSGELFLGSGNEGKVFRVAGEKSSLLYDSPELEVHALAVGPDGRIYAGTSPDGRVYAIAESGQASTFFDPEDKYIWDMAFDSRGNLWVATGASGRLYRVDKSGKAQTVFSSPEMHLTALLVVGDDVYCGSSPNGFLYRIDATGRASALLDTSFREIVAIAPRARGGVYVAAVEAVRDEPLRTAPQRTQAGQQVEGVAQVTVTEVITAVAQPPGQPLAPAVAAQAPRPPGFRQGAVIKVAPDGEAETLWASSDDAPFALLADDHGLWLGTGSQGRLYRVRDDRTWSLEAALSCEQITAIQNRGDGALLLVASNPGKTFLLEQGLNAEGSFISAPHDAGTPALWGQARVSTLPETGAVKLDTRSGNTSIPDTTWSDWSPLETRSIEGRVVSPPGRYLQARIVLTAKGSSPVVTSARLAFQQHNQSPRFTSITVHPAGEAFQKPVTMGSGEIEVQGLETRAGQGSDAQRADGPAVTTLGRKIQVPGIQTISWKVEDANKDGLSYDVLYRTEAGTELTVLRKGLTETVVAWDTNTVPDGRYLVKIVASDLPSNPAASARREERESAPFEIDNTPPSVQLTRVAGKPWRVSAVVRDERSPIKKFEYALDGGPWQELFPADGLNDGREERYEIAAAPGPSVRMVAVRAVDLVGNAGGGHLALDD
jgi:hypothetical protein